MRISDWSSDVCSSDLFTEAIVGKAKSSRGDFTASEDDNVLVTGVAKDKNALGLFGFAYYEENTSRLNSVKIKLNADPTATGPSAAAVVDGSSKPLCRTNFIYVHAKAPPELGRT